MKLRLLTLPRTESNIESGDATPIPLVGERPTAGRFESRTQALDTAHTQPQSSDSPATTTKPDLLPRTRARTECTSEQTRFDAEQRIGDRIGIPHAALDGLAQRHRTRPPRLTPQPTNRRPTASAPGPRHAPHVVELRSSHHVLTQRPRPTHLDAHRVFFGMSACCGRFVWSRL